MIRWNLAHIRPLTFHASTRRRAIPAGISLIALGATLYSALGDSVTELQWLEWSLLALAILFVFKALLFLAMRQTMTTESRKLTTFGVALIDFFTAIVVGDLFLVYLFASAWWALRHDHTQSSYISKVIGRSGLISGTVFVVSTGVAVAYEMLRARGHVSVHQEEQLDGDRELV